MSLKTPDSNQIKQNLEKQKHIDNYNFALKLGNYKNAAKEALIICKKDKLYIEKAENCAENLYHTQKRYVDAAEIYKKIAEIYLNLGDNEKYEENMQYAATCYIGAAEDIKDSTESKIKFYNSALNIYQKLEDKELIDMINTTIEKIK